MLVLFNLYLSKEEIGLTRVFFSIASIISQFSMLSMNAVAVRFFHYFKGNLSNRENDFLRIFINRTLIGFAIVIGIGLLLETEIISFFESRSQLVGTYYRSILIFSGFYVVFNLLDNYALVNHLSVFSAIGRELFTRILTSALVLLYVLADLDFHLFITIYTCLYAIPSVFLIFVLIRKNLFHYPWNRSGVSIR
ncbi:MAG: hypothetical protein LPK45_03275, partial [Bacteroidota bacterium]|nr:hypothetical protein [Bacteroidota bacterium]